MAESENNLKEILAYYTIEKEIPMETDEIIGEAEAEIDNYIFQGPRGGNYIITKTGSKRYIPRQIKYFN